MSSFAPHTGLCNRYLEKVPMREFEGTIIDMETIGHFSDCEGVARYRGIRPIVVGFLDCDTIDILYITKGATRSFNELKTALRAKLCEVKHPLYAFNTEFEMGVFYWFLGEAVRFDRDLMFPVNTSDGRTVWESKRLLVKDLNIPNFDDPFWDMGFKVPAAWDNFQKTGNSRFLWEILRHNRACLLKECAILRKRKRWREVNKPIIDGLEKNNWG